MNRKKNSLILIFISFFVIVLLISLIFFKDGKCEPVTIVSKIDITNEYNNNLDDFKIIAEFAAKTTGDFRAYYEAGRLDVYNSNQVITDEKNCSISI